LFYNLVTGTVLPYSAATDDSWRDGIEN